jgi:arylsulfatase A-like enzyme
MAGSDARPNIIVFMAEQQRADTLGCMGCAWMETPNVDRLASEGVVFTNAYAAAATCVSSRASLLSGLYPHSTGIYAFDRWTGAQNWTHVLGESGYQCVSIGKTHMAYGADGGFHDRIAELHNKVVTLTGRRARAEWHTHLATRGFAPPYDIHETIPDFYDRLGAVDWKLPEDLHPDFYVGDVAAAWIERRECDRPLFLHVGFLGPHDPYDPIPRYSEKYMSRDLPAPIGGEEEDVPDDLFVSIRRMENLESPTCIRMSRATPERLKRMRAHYYGNVTMVDEKVGLILDALERKGILENAVVIFTSDHGDCLGDHGLVYKGNMYDGAVRVPLVVWSPSRYAKGIRIDRIVQQMDVAPEVLRLAGCVAPASCEAVSLRPLLEGADDEPTREYVYAEEGRSGLRMAPDLVMMIRDQEWKLVHYVDRPYGQLFNMIEDPEEVHNLWGAPGHAGLRRRLERRLFDWLAAGRYRNRNLYASAR